MLVTISFRDKMILFGRRRNALIRRDLGFLKLYQLMMKKWLALQGNRQTVMSEIRTCLKFNLLCVRFKDSQGF